MSQRVIEHVLTLGIIISPPMFKFPCLTYSFAIYWHPDSPFGNGRIRLGMEQLAASVTIKLVYVLWGVGTVTLYM